MTIPKRNNYEHEIIKICLKDFYLVIMHGCISGFGFRRTAF
jgi:hypothetical protein